MNKLLRATSLLLFVWVGISASGAALAQHHGRFGHGGHASFGFYFGVPLYGPAFQPYYPPGYYPPYYPPVVVVPATPPVYIENGAMQGAPATAEAPGNWWYYCVAAKGYYPYIKDCPGGWQRVAPQPPKG